jgi:hypothetical protein
MKSLQACYCDCQAENYSALFAETGLIFDGQPKLEPSFIAIFFMDSAPQKIARILQIIYRYCANFIGHRFQIYQSTVENLIIDVELNDEFGVRG